MTSSAGNKEERTGNAPIAPQILSARPRTSDHAQSSLPSSIKPATASTPGDSITHPFPLGHTRAASYSSTRPAKVKASIRAIIMPGRMMKKAMADEYAPSDHKHLPAYTTEPLYAYPRPRPRPTVPSSEDPFFNARRTVHRRSRSFSELINSSNSMFSAASSPALSTAQIRVRVVEEQPWRSREAWTALHALPSAFGSSPLLPSAMGDTGGWKGRGGGAFFGADMKGMLPSRQRKGRGRRAAVGEDTAPREKMDEWVVVEEEEVEPASPSTTPTRLALPTEPALLAPFTPMSRRKTRSAYHIRDSVLGHPPSSSSSDDRWDVEVHTPTFDDSDDDSLLPPLLPYAIPSRAESFSSLPDSPPIPWGRASPVPSIRTPTLVARAPPSPHSPRTPTRQTTSPLSIVSRGTPKTWTQATPSPPRKSRPILSPRGSHESEPPRTPTRHRPEVHRSATSPQMVKFDLRELRERDEKECGVPVMPKASPSKFWSAPRGWMEKKKVEGEGDKAWRGLLFRQARAGAA